MDSYLERLVMHIRKRYPPKDDYETRWITSLRETNPVLWIELVRRKLDATNHACAEINPIYSYALPWDHLRIPPWSGP